MAKGKDRKDLDSGGGDPVPSSTGKNDFNSGGGVYDHNTNTYTKFNGDTWAEYKDADAEYMWGKRHGG